VSPRSLIAAVPTPYTLSLRFADVPIRVTTNDPDVRTRLASYFRPFVIGDDAAPLAEVSLIQGRIPVDGEFVDVTRDGGRRPKEATRDVPGGRLVLKRVTGVLIGLWPSGAFAAGDILANLNQGINLVNNCYAKVILRRGHVLLHASAVSRDRRTAVLAGPPGAGKSTSALHLVEAGFRCLSNDRVLARPTGETVEALGYPKQPRVNPGTLLGHPRLSTLLAATDRAALAALPPGELWDFERKSDVDLDSIYGDGTVELRGRMAALVLLRWRRDGRGLGVRRLDVDEALAALPLVYKNLGAFDLDRAPGAPVADAEREQYRELFARVALVEITGGVDFGALTGIVKDLLAG
jgi:HprK-related kinase B